MAKNEAQESNGEQGASSQVVLPNGVKRIDFIRDEFYGEGELKGNRSGIKNAINKMYEDAGQTDKQIPYQIVFSATKDEVDPRIAAAQRKEEQQKAKAAKEAAEAEAKEAAKKSEAKPAAEAKADKKA